MIIDGHGSIGANAFEGATLVTSVTIPYSVTSIGDNAFRNCSAINSISMSNTTVTIGDNAFSDMSSTGTVRVSGLNTGEELNTWKESYYDKFVSNPNTVTVVVMTESGLMTETKSDGINYVFSIVSGTDVRIGSGVSVLGNGITTTTSIDSMSVPSSFVGGFNVTTIGNYALSSLNMTGTLTIPGTVTLIEYNAFSNNNSLSSLNLPNSVTTIGEYAFANTSITEVTIPISVHTIGNRAFSTLSNSIETVNIHKNAITYPGVSNIAFPNMTSTAVVVLLGMDNANDLNAWKSNYADHFSSVSSGGIDGEVTFITEIFGIMTMMYQDIVFVFTVISETSPIMGTVVGTGGISVRIGDDTNTTGNGTTTTFTDLEMTHLNIPGSFGATRVYTVTEIGTYAFSTLFINTVVIPASCSVIKEYAFSENTLTSVFIPNPNTSLSIGDLAFWGLDTLASVSLPYNNITYGSNVFHSTETADLVVTVRGISLSSDLNEWKSTYANDLFDTTDSSRTVVFVTETGNVTTNTVNNITYIITLIGSGENQSIKIGDDTTRSGNGVIGSYSSDIIIPSHFTVNSIEYPLTKIGAYAFRGLELTSVVIPATVITIDNYAFAGDIETNALTSVVFDEVSESSRCATIGAYAFLNAGIEDIVIPRSMMSIGQSAFRSNIYLKQVSLFQAVTLGLYAFKDMTTSPRILVRNIKTWYELLDWRNLNEIHFSTFDDTDILFIPYFDGINWSNICFPAGTPVMTDQGSVAIDKICINKHTIRGARIVAITRTVTEDECLIRFEPGSLYTGVPSIRTEMTCEHQVFYQNRMVPAVSLTSMKSLKNSVHKVPYNGEVLFNVLLDAPGKMMINNLIAETLHPNNGVAKLTRTLLAITDENERYDVASNYNIRAKELGVFTKIKHRL